MKFSRLIIAAVVVIGIAWAVKAYAGSLTMNTYYPAPTGYYETLTVTKKLFMPCYPQNTVTAGVPPANAVYHIDLTNSMAGCTTYPF